MASSIYNELDHELPSVPPELFLNFQRYEKLKESLDHGKEYEQLMCALYGLKLSISDDVDDFEMTSNHKKCGVFDDIELIVSFKGGIKRRYLLQLKHKDNEQCIKVKELTTTNTKAPFCLLKYLDSLEQIEDAVCILYTNSSTNLKNNETLQEVDLIAEENNTIEYGDLLLNTKTSAKSTVVFNFKSNSNNTRKQFYMFTQQHNVYAVKTIIENLLKSIVKADIYAAFVHFIKEWWAENFVLTKHELITKIVEMALSPYIKTLSASKHNHKSNQIAKLIMKFEMTIVESDEGIVNNIWPVVEQSYELKVAMKKFGITSKEASVLQKTKILWHLDLVPFVVKVENFIEVKPILQLLRRSVKNKRVVLLGNINKEDVADWSLFTNLSDLTAMSGHENFSNIQKSLTVSLQGQNCITLEHLIAIDETMATYIGIEQLLKMSHEDFLYIGNAKKSEDFYHIPRTVTTKFVKTSYFLNSYKYANDCLVIINCKEIEKKQLDDSTLEVVILSDYLMDDDKDKYKNVILVCTDRKCTSATFEQVCIQSKMAEVYVLEIYDDDSSMVVMRKGDKLISKDIIQEVKQIKEDEIFQHFRSQLNVICAAPGMGKSRLLQSMRKNHCPSDLWLVYVELINHKKFFQTFSKNFANPTNYETMLSYFLEIDDTSCDFLSKVKKAFTQNKKILLFLDGLDEVDNKFILMVLRFAKYMSQAGVHIWMSSRENLTSLILHQLFVVPVEIEEFTKEDQREYLNNRLEIKYGKDEIENIVTAVFKSAEVSNSQQLLGIPLQLYIITEMLLNSEEAYSKMGENTFIITKLYKEFFNGKIKFSLEKLGVDQCEEQLCINVDHHLKLYQIPALQICLDDTDFKTLKIRVKEIKDVKPFLVQLKKSGDKSGIVKEIVNEEQAVFVHQTFAEYFACVWLTDHPEKLFLMRESFFSEKYQNLRLIFDVMMCEDNPLHLAVIYRNVEQVNAHMDCVETTDEGNRTCLHLVCCHGMSYFSSCHRLNREPDGYVEIFQRLLPECDILAEDTLFEFSCFDYAVASRSLYALEKMLEKEVVCWEKALEIFQQNLETHIIIVFYACQFGYPNVLRAVITTNPEIINKIFDNNKSLLHVAILGSINDTYLQPRELNIAVVKMLAENGLRLNSDIMEYACQNGCYDMLEPLHTLGVRCKDGATFLHKVTEYCDVNDCVLKAVTTLKIDVDARDDDGTTALQIACKRGDITNVRKLLDFGAQTNIVDNQNRTALHYVMQSYVKDCEIIDLLIEKGVDIDGRDQHGNTALHDACSISWFEGVQTLLYHKADPTVVNIYNETILFTAVAALKDNTKVIEFLISKYNFDVNAKSQDHGTLLHRACRSGRTELVKLLLDLDCNVNQVDDFGATALHYAAEVGANMELIELLLTSDIKIDAQDEDGKTALHFAIKNNHLDVVRTLFKHGANGRIVDKDKANILHYASGAMNECTEILNELLNRKTFNVNLPDNTGKTPLHFACERGIFSHVKMLCDKGAKVRVVDFNNTTSLHYAAQALDQNEQILVFLNGLGLDIDARNDKQQTALHFACKMGPVENVETLLSMDASANAVDEEGNNMLHYAAANIGNNTKIISIMIDKQIDVNAKNKQGTTPLQLTCRHYKLEAVQLLLNNDANINCIDDNEMNALHYAAQSDKENTEVIKFLIEKGLEVNSKDINGRTPLHFACYYGVTQNMHILINRSAKVDAEDKNKMTLLHYASSSEFENVSVLNFLLTNLKFNANTCNSTGETSLHLAVKNGNFMNVELLLNHIDIKALTSIEESESILHYAVKSQNSEVLLEELLLNREFNVDAYDVVRTTVLLAACQYSDYNTVKLLIDNGADFRSVDKFGHNALHYAVLAKKPDKDLIKLLIALGVEIDDKSCEEIVTSYALKMECYGAVKIFIEENLFKLEDVNFLFYAVYCGSTVGVNLICNRIDIQNIDLNNDVYPLYFARRNDHLDSDLLLKMTYFINMLIEYFSDESSVRYSHKGLVMYLKTHFLSTFEGFHEVDDPYLFNRRCKHIKKFFQENCIVSI